MYNNFSVMYYLILKRNREKSNNFKNIYLKILVINKLNGKINYILTELKFCSMTTLNFT